MHEIDAIREPAAVGAGGSGIKSPRSITARLPAPAVPTSTVQLVTGADAPSGSPSESKAGRIIAIVIVTLGLLAIVGWWWLSRR